MSSATTTNNSNINNNAVTINSAFSNTESINSPRALPTMDELVIAANSSTTATPVAGVNKNSVNSFDNDGHVPSPRSKKPVWGWDYIMNFGLPADLEENVETAGQVSERNEHVSSSFMSILPTYPRSETPPQVVRRRSQQQLQERMEIFARLKSAGFFISQLLVPRERMIVVRLSLDEETLKEKAVHMGLELQLKKEYGSGYLDYSPQREYAFINEDMQQTWNCYFSPAQRALIILTVLQSKEHWGCDLSVEKLLCNQTVLQMFLLHSPPERDALVQNVVWKRLWDPTWKPSMDALREYFGGKFSVRSYVTTVMLTH